MLNLKGPYFGSLFHWKCTILAVPRVSLVWIKIGYNLAPEYKNWPSLSNTIIRVLQKQKVKWISVVFKKTSNMFELLRKMENAWKFGKYSKYFWKPRVRKGKLLHLFFLISLKNIQFSGLLFQKCLVKPYTNQKELMLESRRDDNIKSIKFGTTCKFR